MIEMRRPAFRRPGREPRGSSCFPTLRECLESRYSKRPQTARRKPRAETVLGNGRRNYPIIGGLLLMFVCLMACTRSARRGELIERYVAASCIRPLAAPKHIRPPTREWEQAISTSEGGEATVSGAQSPGGRILITYKSTQEVVIAAWAGDYIYPADVRYDRSSGRLFVKADGLAGGIHRQTWLVEFNVNSRQEVRRQRVDPEVMPPECTPQ